MPRTVQEILDHADELAARFEDDTAASHDATALRSLRDAVTARADAERSITQAVTAARTAGHSWSAIGAMLGTSSEAARQRYGRHLKAS
jgi:hypothetical protein